MTETKWVQDVSKNLDWILRSGIKSEDLLLVRVVHDRYLNQRDNSFYASPHTPSIHFSLNHFVESHMYGDWSDANCAVLAPFGNLIKYNPDNFVGAIPVDVFAIGYAELPDHEILYRDPSESPKDFRDRVHSLILDLGLPVLPGGMWSWGDSWTATDRFSEFIKQFKSVVNAPHTHTVFNRNDKQTYFEVLEDGGFEKIYDAKMDLVRRSWLENFPLTIEKECEDFADSAEWASDEDDRQQCDQLIQVYRDLPERLERPLKKWNLYWQSQESSIQRHNL